MTGSSQASSKTAPSERHWRVVLPNGLREQALECVHAIANDLSGGAAPLPEGIEKNWNHSLGYGNAGLALFFHYLYLADAYPIAVHGRDSFLSASTRAINQQRMPPDLYRGFSGIAWVWKHIHQELESGNKEAAWAEIDQALQAWVQRESTAPELFEGLGGVCLYVAEDPSGFGENLLASITSKLEAEARPRPTGTAFAMSKKMRQHWTANFGQEPTDLWKISVAHGNVGCLGGLAAAMTFESCFTPAARLLTEVSEWIWSQQTDRLRAFPEMVGADLPCLTSGWCNGDLGISLALLQVARRLGRRDWQARALAIARTEALARVDKVERNNQRNYSLCHGHAGRGHIFNGLYQMTGEELFAEAAIYWFQQCLALRAQGEGVGGFLLDEGFDRGVKATRGFLMGASGLGLALLAAATPVAPDWDRLLLVSMRGA